MLRKAFTLMEVNLAILIMAGGILSIVGLYSLGFRENSQSVEDVASAAYADAVFSPLIAALSSTNVTWETFSRLENQPPNQGEAKGWARYFKDRSTGRLVENPESLASDAFDQIMTKLKTESGIDMPFPTGESFGKLKAGLVVLHDEGSAVVRLGFRAAKNPEQLFAAPHYYTEVRFQGIVKRQLGATE